MEHRGQISLAPFILSDQRFMHIQTPNNQKNNTEQEPLRWHVAQMPYMSKELMERVKSLPIETFIPILKNEKLLTFNYIFIHGCSKDVIAISKDFSRLHILYKRPVRPQATQSNNYVKTPMIVSDREMEMFMRTVGLYTNGAPIAEVDEEALRNGDTVRIIGGPFKGVEGTLVTRKGKEGGKVVVSISNLIAVTTLDIEPKDIQVIKFSPDNRHIYKKLEVFIPRLQQMITTRLSGGTIEEKDYELARTIITNYADAEVETQNMQAKLYTVILMAYLILGIPDCISKYYHKLKTDILPKIMSARVRELIETQLKNCEEIVTT